MTALPPKDALGTRKRVLVMDDEEMIRDLATDRLDELGYEACTAVDGSEAIRFFTEAMQNGDPFGAVILHLTVPGAIGGHARCI